MLINKWKMFYDTYEPIDCVVPCTMYSVLIDNNLIADPYYQLNEQAATKLSEKDCVFEAEFELSEEQLEKEYNELCFSGLDTICRIILNGEVLADVKNMHRSYIYDVKNILVSGKNNLCLEFSSPINYFKEMNNKHYLYTGSTIKGAPHLRKAFYMAGWDWGPALPDMGIYRPVSLNSYNDDKIENLFVRQIHKNGKVILDIEVETKHNKNFDCYVNIDGKEIKLINNKGSLEIDNPRLWWARGYGEQNLYEITARLEKNGVVISEKTDKIGLRTITVSTAPDKHGKEFAFVLNGKKIFAMGSNYIPEEIILNRPDYQKTKELIKSAVFANHNMIRVWGGGYYPEEYFYDLCDEYGIIVWQDFMVACANIRLTSEMREEFTAEVTENIKKYRNHPSLGLLCGNNEVEYGGIKWKIAESELVRTDYLELYERIIPELCNKYAPDIFYWQSSPSSGGGYDFPSDETRGDIHFWNVLRGDMSFYEYRNHNFRFCSEFGFQAFPVMKTINSFCEPDDLNICSKVMENHQKCNKGNKRLISYLVEHYLYPSTFEGVVYATQLMQADSIRYAVEHFRRIRGICMGSLYWQLNDCWPAISWSSVDYSGRYKGLHYAAKKFYAPVSMGMFLDDNRLTVNISNETLKDFDGKLKIVHSDNRFNEICSEIHAVKVKSLSSADVVSLSFDITDKYNEYVYAELYDENNNFLLRNTELFVSNKYFEFILPQISYTVNKETDGYLISFSSDVFAKGVYIDFEDFDFILSDNFFDLTNKEEYQIMVYADCSKEEIENSIKIMSVYDIGRSK